MKEKNLTLNLILGIKDEQKIKEIIDEIHPVDFLEELKNYDDDISELLSKIPSYYIVMLIDEAEIEYKVEIFSHLDNSIKPEIINDMSSDELVDMLQVPHFDERDRKTIISHLEPEEQTEITEMLSYKEDTAGGLMATEFLSVKEDMNVEKTIEYFREMAPDYETPYYAYVLDDDEVLRGVIPLRALLISPPERKIKDFMVKSVITVDVNTDQEEVAIQFEKYGLAAMPVVDDKERMLGIITFDDIIPIISEEHTEDMYLMAGIDGEEEVDGSIIKSVKSRLVWLIVNLFTAIAASNVIAMFEGTISQIVALAALMPIVSGMGGNAATQTLTLIIRGLATGNIKPNNILKILVKEIGVGLIDGIVVGVILCLITLLWFKNGYLGIIIMAALAANITLSAIVGTLVPLTIKKYGADPAVASSVFVTTFTDICGFGIFLGLATVFMHYLV